MLLERISPGNCIAFSRTTLGHVVTLSLWNDQCIWVRGLTNATIASKVRFLCSFGALPRGVLSTMSTSSITKCLNTCDKNSVSRLAWPILLFAWSSLRYTASCGKISFASDGLALVSGRVYLCNRSLECLFTHALDVVTIPGVFPITVQLKRVIFRGS